MATSSKYKHRLHDIGPKYTPVPPGTKPPRGYFAVQPWGILPICPPVDMGNGDVFASPALNNHYSLHNPHAIFGGVIIE